MSTELNAQVITELITEKCKVEGIEVTEGKFVPQPPTVLEWPDELPEPSKPLEVPPRYLQLEKIGNSYMGIPLGTNEEIATNIVNELKKKQTKKVEMACMVEGGQDEPSVRVMFAEIN